MPRRIRAARTETALVLGARWAWQDAAGCRGEEERASERRRRMRRTGRRAA